MSQVDIDKTAKAIEGELSKLPVDQARRVLAEMAHCIQGLRPFQPSRDTDEWILHKLTDDSWAAWRLENQEFVEENAALIGNASLIASLKEIDYES